VSFVVDTGASVVSISSADAQRLGINYTRGKPATMLTANGPARAYRVIFESVRVGDITLENVEGVVMENLSMPALLGMSFLNRMNMRREGQLLTLTKRF
jgi:aspartyl protease family protein